MSRIAAVFSALRDQGRQALIPFVTAGDPDPATTLPLMHAMVEAGADIIELGVPFSDPMADGPVIQRASERALRHHIALHDVIDMVRRFRETDQATPVVLMGYLNPLEAMGYETFAEAAAEAGVDGVLTVDIPPEEAATFVPAMKSNGIDPIFLLAPTSNRARIERITATASGFVYYVSLKGVTGAGNLSLDSVRAKLAEIRSCTDLPVGVGFGIKDATTAAAMAGFADAVVVGSALVSRIEANPDDVQKAVAEIKALLSEMRTAMDAD
ncbi:MAG: tryptophan synthase subunit alpha [Chromatiaceae bacterium]|jgi:tryptophan synthase alpha chain|nr:tryptophan synthase subunit alpha [Chromatiaceae bacterium]